MMGNLSFTLILDLLLFLLTFPLLALTTIIFWLYKRFVICVAKLIVSKELDALSGCDAIMALDNFAIPKEEAAIATKMGLNLGLVLRLSNKNMEIEWLRNKFNSTFLKPKRNESSDFLRLFTYLIQFGGYSFRKPVEAIDINYHIQEEIVPTEQCLEQFLANFLKTSFEKERPFWKILLIPSPDSKEEVLIVFKIHHSLGDGYTLIHMMDLLTDSKTPYMVEKCQDSFWDKLKLAIQTPRLLWETFWTITHTSPPFPVEKSEDEDFISFTTLDLNDLKKVRKATNCKFISIFVTLVGGATRRILLEKCTEDKLPQYTDISSALAWPDHPCFRDSPPEMCNHWTVGSVKVPMNCKPLDRLMEVDKDYNNHLNRGFTKVTGRYVIKLLGVLPDRIRKLYPEKSPFQTGISMNMGSSKMCYLNGSPITAIQLFLGGAFSSTVIAGMSFSYLNKFECMLFIRNSVAGTQQICDRIVKEYLVEELHELVKQVDASSELCLNKKI